MGGLGWDPRAAGFCPTLGRSMLLPPSGYLFHLPLSNLMILIPCLSLRATAAARSHRQEIFLRLGPPRAIPGFVLSCTITSLTMDYHKPDFLGDIFESALNLEEAHSVEGFKEGYTDGLVSGKEEGYQVGLKHGFETGEELGFYRGCIDIWTSAIRIDPNCFSSRIQKSIKTLDELLQKYPVLDPENKSVTEIMDSLRLKFRSISATLNAKLEYNGYPKTSDDNIEF